MAEQTAEEVSTLIANYLKGRAEIIVEQEEAPWRAWQQQLAELRARREAERAARPKPRVHMVRCTRLPGNCCYSCHEDEDLGYDNLYWDDHEVPGRTDFELGEYHCCAKSERVKARIERMIHRLMPKKSCGCACNCHGEESRPYWPGPCAGCCDPYERYACDCTEALRRAWGWDEGYPPA